MADPRSIKDIVHKRVVDLQYSYLRNESAGVAALAKLRRGLGKPTGTVFDILGYTHDDAFVRDRDDDRATPQENASHLAMTLFAAHQQSQSRPMHRPGTRFGQAVRRLVPDPKHAAAPDNAIVRRFAMIGTATDFDELTHHLRGMVQLLRSQQIPLDYGQLADDLVDVQDPRTAAAVRLRWGRAFHITPKTSDDPAATEN
ncbi:type I-E CRISPR-associated protein Cse2/CasB [Actinokineospora sp. HUAS TT18]|uniref:type I-E CRISPR-associated protein Cse2/CasB n=1 Tax=Actinokineospora sp. HUAS TT18 TaxID=3447451 RepID=UPI003F52622D